MGDLSSWAEVTPLTPTAPITLPSTITGRPPCIGTIPSTDKNPCLPAAMDSSNCLEGRLNNRGRPRFPLRHRNTARLRFVELLE